MDVSGDPCQSGCVFGLTTTILFPILVRNCVTVFRKSHPTGLLRSRFRGYEKWFTEYDNIYVYFMQDSLIMCIDLQFADGCDPVRHHENEVCSYRISSISDIFE